ncbi:MAG TPA: NAD-dependent epimerase/dehydratase family protein [Chitinophagaceae bacterium]|nr:NAD-dependent epimerase/dehydratase family protein [Chitinophagaceae bacterium]HPH30339.1 NAD-dependent epimerase/dehydratase family protein [Chitinophagaceae bacterium]HPN59489.1 NAD-dependent epimerase/dehydratase family protein [Chitinophagaceae bacterium]
MQTILGANGTIGSLLARELAVYTNRIRLVSRNPVAVNPSDELFPADLSDPDIVEKAIAGSEVVYLLVGFDYKLTVWQEKWPRLMRSVIDACIRHQAKLVFFDNVYLYDVGAIGHMTEESPINPPSQKGAVRSRIAGMLMEEVKAGKLQSLIARSADFYGPRNEKSFLIEVVYKNFRKGKKANWFMNADKIHSFTYTPDAAKATALLGNTADAWNQVWHLPTDPARITGRQMISLFAREMKQPDKVMVMPLWLLRVLGLFMPLMREMPEMMYQYDRDYFFDSAKFQQRFGIQPTTYENGVKATIEAGI